MIFELSLQDVQLIGAALGKLPFEQVAPLMNKMGPTVAAEVERLRVAQESEDAKSQN